MSPAFTLHLRRMPSGRHVGLRYGGKGPPALLLHESPRSSAALVPLAQRLASRFTVYAFDNPGFGRSDPVSATRPGAEDYADALIEAMDVLGVARAPLYGTHTGAVIAMAAALRYPTRISALVLDGYPIFSPVEKEELLASYLPAFVPSWDGNHLAWLWGRVKDQFTFFPWNRRGNASRLIRSLAPLETMAAVATDLLLAGDHYRPAYASAFRYDGASAAAGIAIPTTFLARSDDLLFGHLDRLPTLPAAARIVRLEPDRDAWANEVALALARGGELTSVPLPVDPVKPGRRIDHGAGTVIGSEVFGKPDDRRPILLLHDVPGSASGNAALARELAMATGRRVVVPDLPGFGASRAEDATEVVSLAAALRCLPDLDRPDVVTIGASAGLGAAMHGARHVAVDPIPASSRAAFLSAFTDTAPRHDGGHLLAAWHHLRDAELWLPWFDRRPSTILDCGTDPDPERLNGVLAAWIEGGADASVTAAALLGEGFDPEAAVVLRRPPTSPLQRAACIARLLGGQA